MDEKRTSSDSKIRPTKKQKELLTFIEGFIGEHGYSPSYREIMQGLNYNSVATVALHVNSLIKRGHLRKRDHSARSLEVAKPSEPGSVKSSLIQPGEEKWLVDKVDYFFIQAEEQAGLTPPQFNQLQILIETLKILGLEGAAASFAPRLAALRHRLQKVNVSG